MRIALLIAGGLVAGVVLVTVIGAMLPKGHTASRTARLAQPPAEVFRIITTPDAFPVWRGDVKKIERLPDRDGRPAWVEIGRNGRIPLETVEAEPPRRLVLRIADPDLPFGGTWTYELSPAGTGTALTITEDGEIYNPIFRFMARFVFGYEHTLASYLDALEKKVGRQAEQG
jgi:uncharacterized protein YndB with AHSA1/START domain